MKANLLNEYSLTHSGHIISECDFSSIVSCIEEGIVPVVDRLTPEIIQYNQLSNDKIQELTSVSLPSIEWLIPSNYIDMNIEDRLPADMSTLERNRCNLELSYFKSHNLMILIRVMIYIFDTLEENSIVWGPGRGSSVSSYVFYLLGFHDVDCIKYDIDIKDFFHN